MKVPAFGPRRGSVFDGGETLEDDVIGTRFTEPGGFLFLRGRPRGRFGGCLGTDPAGSLSLRGRPTGLRPLIGTVVVVPTG
jgi:hypothetical protein